MTDEEYNVALEQFFNAKDENDMEKLPEDFPYQLMMKENTKKVAEKLVSLGSFIGIEEYKDVIKELILSLNIDEDCDTLKALVNNYIDSDDWCLSVEDYSDAPFWIIVGTYFDNGGAKNAFDMYNECLEEDWTDIAYEVSEYLERVKYEQSEDDNDKLIQLLEKGCPSFMDDEQFYAALYYCYTEVGEDKDAKKALKELQYYGDPNKKEIVIFRTRKDHGFEIANPLYKEPGLDKEPETEEKPAAPKKTKSTKKASASKPAAPKRKGRKKSSSPLKSAKRAIYNKLVKPLKKWF